MSSPCSTRTARSATSDQAAIQTEVNQLASEIERIGTSAEFNGIKLLTATGTVTFQVGANDGDTIAVSTISPGQHRRLVVSSADVGGNADLSEIDAAINAVSSARATFGAVQNRLEHSLSANAASTTRTWSPPSRASATWTWPRRWSTFTKNQILQQAGTSMLAQANQAPQSVLSLLR